MALNWTSIETALAAWAASASGLATSKVLWGLQGVAVPAPPDRPYVRLTWGARDLPVGNGVRDEARTASTALGTRTVVHFRTHVLSLGYFAAVPTSAAGASGAAAAALGSMLRNLQLESTRATLAAAGLRLVSVSDPQDVSAMLETGFETRAVVDLEFMTADTTTEQVGKISTVDGPAGTVT